MFLVLGAYGQLGSCFREQLKEGYFPSVNECDITDFTSIKNYVKGKTISVIINCAAYTNTSKAESEEKELCYAINAQGVKNLAMVSKELKIPLIHFSTDFVFGEQEKEFYESDRVCPLNEYGKSKALGEKEFLKHAYKGSIIRVAYLYSCYGNNIIKVFKNLLETKSNINVVKDQYISITNAHSLVNVVLGKLVNNNDALSGLHIYHFVSKGCLTLLDLAKFIKLKIASKCQIVPISLKDYPSNIKRSHSTLLNCNKIEKDLNIVRKAWQEEVEECLKKL